MGLDVLTFLTEQGLTPTPANYELAYCYRSDRQTLVARAIDAVTMTGDQLSQAKATELLAVLRQTNDSAPDDERSRMRDHTRELADLAALAKAATGQFGRDLAGGLDEMGVEGVNVAAIVSAMIERSRDTEQALVEASRQIETLRQEVEAAKGDASRDALTGLHNRRGVESEVLGLSGRQHSVVALCDIDHFKLINDRHGHAIGDRVLKAVASSLAESCHPHLVARWGGEEFIILMNGVDLNSAATMVNRARTQLSTRSLKVSETGELLGTITFSAGVAVLDGRKFEVAVNRADILLYRAKANGRDQVISEPVDP
ncbi:MULTISPECIES: GGDEF domain-containing protein [unclassified Sphingomonas]|uniref:GGDEF domain-containing protein n=1 Tax=unclassified Sphingomonas TaxID=196159 RepID=UPI00226A309B|nr:MULTISPECIES: GGDEF domain-containing protein [unclassified Sphingomonas]